MHVKKNDFILKIEKKYFDRNFCPKNHSNYPNNKDVPPSRKRAYLRQRLHSPFPQQGRAIRATLVACSKWNSLNTNKNKYLVK